MTTFDPYDQNSWFFGQLTRQQAIEILEFERDKGVFLVRYSHSVAGDLVLSVSEEQKISHYIINKIDLNGEPKFKIGENTFHDMPSLLTYYKHHYLDTTALIRAAKKKLEYVRAKFDFLGKDKEDLPFKKNELLTIISKEEDQWWRARNDCGQIGSIPVPYVETIDEEEYLCEKGKFDETNDEIVDGKSLNNNHNNKRHSNEIISSLESSTSTTTKLSSTPSLSSTTTTMMDPSTISNMNSSSNNSSSSGNLASQESLSSSTTITTTTTNDNQQQQQQSTTNNNNTKKSTTNMNSVKLPAKAIVIQQRIPNAYDKKALKLEKGDIITVTNTNLNGQWEGELNGKHGHFPFNYIKFLDEDQ
ncbi:crk proto-oncogene, adaptor protein [Dermatophagoides pteronyssinus]|uniref:Adapter molecule Crk-like n=1 Tax=Dermatophagoides pteronyssinus TaxID=6956 RepID=A0A6P6Y3E8_DERPT|nr:adapter molecule Crk-like [Dermatophagoides pteronyssinus]